MRRSRSTIESTIENVRTILMSYNEQKRIFTEKGYPCLFKNPALYKRASVCSQLNETIPEILRVFPSPLG